MFGRGGFVPLMPEVIAFTADTLSFAGIPYVGTEGPFELPAWTRITAAVPRTTILLLIATQRFAT
jgi:hypothetical protein